MTRHAHLHGARRSQTRRIHNRASPSIPRMLLAGTVTPLAIDTFRQIHRKRDRRIRSGIAPARLRITVMAKHAAVIDLAGEALVPGPVITWTHAPEPAAAFIPRDGKLDQLVVRRPVQVRPRI